MAKKAERDAKKAEKLEKTATSAADKEAKEAQKAEKLAEKEAKKAEMQAKKEAKALADAEKAKMPKKPRSSYIFFADEVRGTLTRGARLPSPFAPPSRSRALAVSPPSRALLAEPVPASSLASRRLRSVRRSRPPTPR